MNAAPGKVDYFVAGQGLAGSLVARALLRRGRKVVVIDASDPSASSRVAAGLINPVTGQKFVRTWRADTLLPFARDYYRTWEAELGIRVYSEKTIWRFFDSEKEAEIWQQKRDDPKLAVYAAALPEGASERSGLRPQLGGIRVRDAAHVDTKNLLEAFREQLRRLGLLVEERVSAEEFQVGGGHVSWRDRTARKIVFCEGHAASSNPYFSWIPFRPAKGQVLTVRDPDFAVPDDLVMNRS